MTKNAAAEMVAAVLRRGKKRRVRYEKNSTKFWTNCRAGKAHRISLKLTAQRLPTGFEIPDGKGDRLDNSWARRIGRNERTRTKEALICGGGGPLVAGVELARQSGDQEVRIPALRQARPARREPVRDALRALLSNQAARGAGSQQWRSPASDVVKRRAFKQTELFPDRELLGAQFGGVALFALRPTAKLDDLVCGRVHVVGQRHGTLMLRRRTAS